MISGYILSVVCTAVLCGLIMQLFDPKSPVSGVIKMVLGTIMTVTVLAPIMQENMFSLDTYFESINEERLQAVTAGREYAWVTQGELIKEKTQSYILMKAEELGLDLTVDVSLDCDNVPVATHFIGNASPYLKMQLENYVHNQLAIQEGCVTWN